MKFKVLGREADVRWNHFFVVLAVYIGLGILETILGFIYAFSASILLNGQGFSEAFSDYLGIQTIAVMIISYPLTTFLFLIVSERFFKLKRDNALCRSLACANFFIGIILAPLTIFTLYYYGYVSSLANGLSRFFGGIFSVIVGAVILYLWLLVFLKTDKPKIKKSLELGLALSIIYFLIIESAKFLVSYQSGGSYSLSIILNNPISFISEMATVFLFGFVMLYHIQAKKIGKEDYLFAGIYLAPPIISILLSYIVVLAMGGIPGSINFSLDSSNEAGFLARRIVELILLAVLAKVKL